MKIRKVIGRSKIARQEQGTKHMVVSNQRCYLSDIDDVPVGTPIEIVALVEPERRLIRPEGAAWIANHRCPGNYELFVPDRTVATVVRCNNHSKWSVQRAEWNVADDFDEAQRAAEEALADAGMYGFGWKSDDDYDYYIVEAVARPTNKCGAATGFLYYHDAMDGFNRRKASDWKTVILLGKRGNTVTELDRWPKEGEDG